MLYILDAIKWNNNNGFLIPSNYRELIAENKGFHTIGEKDSQKETLMKEWDNGSGWLYAGFSVKYMSASGFAFFEPFETAQDAKTWIDELLFKKQAMFAWHTHDDLLRMWPNAPRISKESWENIGEQLTAGSQGGRYAA